jgi:hypothetical protein
MAMGKRLNQFLREHGFDDFTDEGDTTTIQPTLPESAGQLDAVAAVVHAGAFNLGLWMRTLFGIGTPRAARLLLSPP